MKRLLALGLLLFSTQAALAQAGEATHQGLSIVSTGRVQVAPDIAIIDAGVVTEGKTAEEALAKNRPAMNRMRETVTQYGIAPGDMATSQLRIGPKFSAPAALPSGIRPPREIIGYEAQTALTITVRDIGKAGALVDTLVKSGSNSISNVRFGLTDPATAKNLSRRKAAQDARAMATLYAESLGVQLGDLVSANEVDAPHGEADLPSRRKVSGEMPTVVEPGEIEVATSLKTIWQIKK
ncbi:SIMPL domain-containing protein [Bosea sp. MMO-172]|uniref:SIMPL domain-containing protein n=1 Tax=Bosea sp. MMO-172 TaxID=3127885 RepID=UPI003017AD29